MLPELEWSDQRPLHEQVADTIRRAIAEGKVQPGERLPPARDLAAALRINANTVLRALRGLRSEGLLEFRRGRGVSVLRRPETQVVLRAKLRDLIGKAQQHGYRTQDIIEWIKESG